MSSVCEVEEGVVAAELVDVFASPVKDPFPVDPLPEDVLAAARDG